MTARHSKKVDKLVAEMKRRIDRSILVGNELMSETLKHLADQSKRRGDGVSKNNATAVGRCDGK